MYRSLIAILLFFSVSYQSFVKLGVVIWYQINKEYIAQNLCENRNQPEKQCCGKCYLNKKLNNVSNTNSDNNNSILDKWNLGEVIAYTLPQTHSFLSAYYKDYIDIHHAFYLNIASEGIFIPVFHPPSYC